MMTIPPGGGPVGACGVLAEVVREQDNVARAEAALAAARRRLAALHEQLGRLAEPLAAVEAGAGSPRAARRVVGARQGATLRQRILAHMAARAEDVFTPASLAPVVGALSRDSVRNSLLVLAARGRIEKLGPGRYRARR